MEIDYSKPIIDPGPTEELTERHLRFCLDCGQRFVLYGDWRFQTILTILRNTIPCPNCGTLGAGEPLNEDYHFKPN